MKRILLHTTLLFVLLSMLILSCEKPSEYTNYNNPYDTESNAYISAPDLITTEVDSIRALEAWAGGEFTNDYGKPVTNKGVCWDTEENPTTEDHCTNDGEGKEAFKSHLTELEPDQTYYVRAYATNVDTTIYGGQRNFITLDGRPIVNTLPITGITTGQAHSGGEITNDGGDNITKRGVCWDTSQNPTISDSCTSDGSGTGSFTSELSPLNPDTRYYVRAYATTTIGTGYGQQQEFHTYRPDDGIRDNTTQIVDVTNPVTGRTWMDRNLGASRAATSPTDSLAYGDLYQWGRAHDGHQNRNSPTTTILSSSDKPGHGDFILTSDDPYDWRSPQNDNFWLGEDGINNPCPIGYRLPTQSEWEAEQQSWNSYNAAGAFASPLKMPMAGIRHNNNGGLDVVGSYGYYWSSTVSFSHSRLLFFYSNNTYIRINARRARGASVRCIKD